VVLSGDVKLVVDNVVKLDAASRADDFAVLLLLMVGTGIDECQSTSLGLHNND
jgi:hypothetical protein